MGKTGIEWVRGSDGSAGYSWNALRAERVVTAGSETVTRSAHHCEHVNEACRFCYAERMNFRLGGLAFKPGHRKDYTFTINEKTLLAPLRMRKPTKIFVESMSDAFGDWWPQEFVDKLYAVMTATPQHDYINLTKRPERRRQYLADSETPIRVDLALFRMRPNIGTFDVPHQWPLRNVIEGTSVSCQDEADEFVPILLRTNCAVRAVSVEPLLGPLDLGQWMDSSFWVICGGESGPGARPMHPSWPRSLRDQCAATGVPFHFKQHGEWLSTRDDEGAISYGSDRSHCWDLNQANEVWAYRVGKKAAGRLLDGVEHNGYPVLRR